MNNDLKRPRKIPNYRISPFTSAPVHPLGIKPSGNALLDGADPTTTGKLRKKLLGDLALLPENILMEIIGNLDDPRDVQNLGCASRLLYAYAYDEELWRKMYTNEYIKMEERLPSDAKIVPYDCYEWKGTWRKTILKLEKEALPKCTNMLFSDLLYRPYQCSQISYTDLFKKIIDFEKRCSDLCVNLNPDFGVPRFKEDEFMLQTFHENYIDKPFILQNENGIIETDKPRWPKWTLNDLLRRFSNEVFRQEAVKWELSFYSKYFKENRDESPLYLFDCNSNAIKEISKEYSVPKIYQEDFFKLFQENGINCRPDHRWLIVGPARSGSTFHKDPNNTSAWNVGLSGMKLWIMLPPGENPPGVLTDQEEEEVTSPVGIAEWIISGYYNDAVKLATNGRCQICITFPGECIYVPSGWWHSVINLTDSVALTENFVPKPILPRVLNFFKNKKNQISGFHLKDLSNSVEEFLGKNACIDSGRVGLLKDFVEFVKKDKVDNEDCGVANGSEISPPIFEFFLELLGQSKYRSEVADYLELMKEIELDAIKEKTNELRNKLRESEVWNRLTSQSEPSFSFAFSYESD